MYAYDPKYTTVRNRVRNLIAEGLLGKTEDITDYTTLKADLNIDSLDMIELVIALEDEFDITISDEETAKLSSVEEVVYLVMEKRFGPVITAVQRPLMRPVGIASPMPGSNGGFTMVCFTSDDVPAGTEVFVAG